MDSVKRAVTASFRRHILNNTAESLVLVTNKAEQWFTLYNYDRAGNLTFTVPPAGVNPIPEDDIVVLDSVDSARMDPSLTCPGPDIYQTKYLQLHVI
jgi:hypothetical protein